MIFKSQTTRDFVVAFIAEAAESLPGLTVHYVRGADPTIKLLSDDGDVQEELNIEKWDTDTIKEFLQTRLM